MFNRRIVEPQRVLHGTRTLHREQRSESSLMRRKPRTYPGRKRFRRRSSACLPCMNIVGHLSGSYEIPQA